MRRCSSSWTRNMQYCAAPLHMDMVMVETIHQWDGASHLGHETSLMLDDRCTWIRWSLRLFTNETVLVILDMKHAVLCSTVAHGYGGYWDYSPMRGCWSSWTWNMQYRAAPLHMDKVIFETIHQWDGASHLGHETSLMLDHRCTWIRWSLRLFTNETVLVILDTKHAVLCSTIAHGYGDGWDYSPMRRC